jgi:hypothetical protein
MAGIGTAIFTNSFSVGTDLVSLTILSVTDNSTVFLDGKKTMFEMQDNSILLKSKSIDAGGVPDHRVLADGWSGSIRVDRAGANFGLLYAYLEAQYYAGAVQTYYTITETTQNASGIGVQRFQYKNCVFHEYKPGAWERESVVVATISIAAQQRVPL